MKDVPHRPVSFLEVAHEDGVAAVCCDEDDHSLWVTAVLGSDEWWDLQGYEIADEEASTVRALAGRLPAHAASAEMRDVRDAVHRATIGDGVWLLVVSRRVPVGGMFVVFRDADGAIVAPAHPAGADAQPISDADVPCPACAGREWDLVTRPQRERHAPERVIVCRRCGYEALPYFGPEPSSPGLPPELPDALQKAGGVVGRIATAALGKWRDYALKVDFPVYGLGSDWVGPRTVAGFGTSGFERAYLVELLHGRFRTGGPVVMVETLREQDERLTVDELVAEVLARRLKTLDPGPDAEPLPSGLSEPAAQLIHRLWELRGEDELTRRVALADRRSATIRVDGQPIEFLVAEAGPLSAAAAAIGELDVSLLTRAVRIDDLELIKIDLSSYQRNTGPGGT